MNMITTTDLNSASFFNRANLQLRDMLTILRGSIQLLGSELPAVRDSRHWEYITKNLQDINNTLNELSAYVENTYPNESLPDGDDMKLSFPKFEHKL